MPEVCMPKGMYHEWTDRGLVKRWTHILTTIPTLNQHERRQLHDQAWSFGIREMYRQMLRFRSIPEVNEFREELEHRYGHDVSSRKGNEIIFTTEQLLNRFPSMYSLPAEEHVEQCQIRK